MRLRLKVSQTRRLKVLRMCFSVMYFAHGHGACIMKLSCWCLTSDLILSHILTFQLIQISFIFSLSAQLIEFLSIWQIIIIKLRNFVLKRYLLLFRVFAWISASLRCEFCSTELTLSSYMRLILWRWVLSRFFVIKLNIFCIVHYGHSHIMIIINLW